MGAKKTWPLAAVAALLLNDGTLGFAPLKATRLNTLSNGGNSRSRINMVSGTTPTERNNRESAALAEHGRSKETAVEALQRLLSRQESEIAETKRLLELYNNAEQLDKEEDPLEHVNGKDVPSELLSVASSILQGFDYGFQSRSEGPNFENLKGGNQAFVGYGPPANVLEVGSQQFMRNLKAMRNEYEDEEDVGMCKIIIM